MDRTLTVARFALIEVDIDKYPNVCFCIIFNGIYTAGTIRFYIQFCNAMKTQMWNCFPIEM